MATEAAPFIIAAILVLLSEISGFLVQRKVEAFYKLKWAESGVGPPGFARAKEIARVFSWGLSAAQAMSAGVAPAITGLFLVEARSVVLNIGYAGTLVFGFALFAFLYAQDPESFPYDERLTISIPGRVAIALNGALAAAVFIFG